MIYTDGHNCDIVSGLIIGHFSQYLKELQAIKCITNDCFTMVKWSKENIKKSNYNDMQNSTSVMVNISTNFSKANNHLHLHSLDVKQTTTLTSEPCLGQAQQCGGYGIPNFPSCIQFYFNHKNVNALQPCTSVTRMLLEILSRVRFPSVYTFNLLITYTTYILPL
jgi:hypothetical protein